jgi:tyramine---L-glutamate ligase
MKILIHEYITGGGLAGCPLPESLAREGRAMRRALVNEFRQVEGAEIIETLDERFGDEAHGLILVGSGQELDVLTQTASRCDFTLVIAPETGGVLEERTRRVENVGRSLGSASAAVALTGDKLAFAGHLRERGIATLRTVLYDALRGLPEGFKAPYVMKPRDGAGSVETRYVEAGAPVGVFRDPMIVQECYPGDPMSASFLVGADGFERLWGVGWQSVVVENGLYLYQGGRVPAPATFATGTVREAVRSVEGLRGWVGVDFIRDPITGDCVVLEVNPRVTTSIVGWLARGRPGVLARAWLRAVAGCRVRLKSTRGARLCDRSTRFLPDGTTGEALLS